ncbi:unnamed protein product [Cylindrotheca closterium]|uniref:Uncharacterized protein n=1 Tax=Cylindrotheca closterium TaxID=2856 RepID=A0AAD2G5L5_9STRA|nr:unnamed protein product [Cylindrotheca closterium]
MAKKRKKSISPPKKAAVSSNPLYEKQQAFLNSLSERERNELFHPEIEADRRAKLWMDQADLGEALVNQYAWATPSPHALKILKEFSPIVEVGCGANAYWASCMKEGGIDVIAYDMQIDTGGKIKANKSGKNGKDKSGRNASDSLVKQGGPVSLKNHKNRALFLCYPDEDGEGMGAQCLEHYTGTHVIHVGETILDATLSMDQAPWGRSSSSEFQARLAGEYHCILKVELPSWLHVRDSISVWKRSETSTIVFAADSEDDDEEDEEIEYRHIPCSERLPINVAAPCCAHLLLPSSTATTAVPTTVAANDAPAETKQRNRSSSSDGTKTKNGEDHKMKTAETERKEAPPKNSARARSESHDSSSSSKQKSKKRSRSDSTDSKRSRSDSVDSQKKRKRSNSSDSTSIKGRERSDSTDSAKKRRKLEKEHQKKIDDLFAGGYDLEPATPPRKRSKVAYKSPW